MSEDRILEIFADRRTLPVFEDREEIAFFEYRVLNIADDERELEVNLP